MLTVPILQPRFDSQSAHSFLLALIKNQESLVNSDMDDLMLSYRLNNIDFSMPVSQNDGSQTTLLSLSIMNNRLDVVQFLYSCSESIFEMNDRSCEWHIKDRMNALHAASSEDNFFKTKNILSVIEWLIQQTTNVEYLNSLYDKLVDSSELIALKLIFFNRFEALKVIEMKRLIENQYQLLNNRAILSRDKIKRFQTIIESMTFQNYANHTILDENCSPHIKMVYIGLATCYLRLARPCSKKDKKMDLLNKAHAALNSAWQPTSIPRLNDRHQALLNEIIKMKKSIHRDRQYSPYTPFHDSNPQSNLSISPCKTIDRTLRHR